MHGSHCSYSEIQVCVMALLTLVYLSLGCVSLSNVGFACLGTLSIPNNISSKVSQDLILYTKDRKL